MRAPVTVVAATFEDLVAIGLRQIISEDTNLQLIADGIPLDQLEAAIKKHEPSVVLLNFGSLPNPAYVYQLHQQAPDTRIVVLANRPSATECSQMLSFGATACLSKETEARDVISSIHLAARGMYVLPEASPTDAEGRVRIHGLDQLTPREGEVLERLQEGATNAEIADDLGIGVETVRTHARKIYRKLGVASRRELARLESKGLVSLK
jgi:DNA-binding NarL/FixJ family response regulator